MTDKFDDGFRFLGNRNTMTMEKCEILYRNDVDFHALVGALEDMIQKLHLSPSEIRSAAMYACVRHEIMHVTPINRGNIR